jgi:hypothetical protein
MPIKFLHDIDATGELQGTSLDINGNAVISTVGVALANQPAIPLLVDNAGGSVDGRVFINVKHNNINTASAVGAGLQMQAGAVTSGTASYFSSQIFLQSASPGNHTIHSAPKGYKFYVDNHDTAAGAGTNYSAFGDLALTIDEDRSIYVATNLNVDGILEGDQLDINGNADISGSLTLHGSLAGKSDNTTEVGTYSTGAIKRIRMAQGGELHFGDTTTAAPLGITEGNWNSFSDNDYLSIYGRSQIKLYAGALNATLAATLNSGGLTVANTLTATGLDINGAADISGNLVLGSYTVASQGNQNAFGKISSFANSGAENLYLGIKNASYPNRGWAFNPVTNGVNSNLIIKEHGSSGDRIKIYTGGNFEVLTGSVTATGLDINGNADISGTTRFGNTISIVGTNSTGAETVLLRGISSNNGDLLGSIRTANTGGYNQEMRFYTSNANGTSDEDLTLTLKPDQSAAFTGNVTAAGTATATSFISSTDSGININGLTMTRVAANSAIRVSNGLETLGLLRSYAGLNIATTGIFGGSVTIPDYIIHAGDTDTKFGFSGADTFSVNTGGTNRFYITNNQATLGSSVRLIANGGLTLPTSDTFTHGKTATAFFEKSFANGTANLGCILQFPNQQLQGYLRITLTGSYSNQNMVGRLVKTIPFGFNQNGSIWHAGSDYSVDSTGPVGNNFTIGDIVWNSTTSTYDIPIYHIVSTGNTLRIRVEYYGVSAAQIDNVTCTNAASITIPSVYASRMATRITEVAEFTGTIKLPNSNTLTGSSGKVAFNGRVSGSTPTGTTDFTTKAYVDLQVSNLVDSAPGNLNTLNELAEALNDDDDAIVTINTALAARLPLAGGTMSGAIAMGNQNITGVNNIQANGNIALFTSTGEYSLYGEANAQTALYHNGVKKFETTSGGIDVIGDVTVSGGDIVLGGTGRIQGIDTVTASTDAASKAYVDGAIIANTDTQDLSISGQTLSLTDGGSVTIPTQTSVSGNAGSVTNGVYTTGDQSIDGKKTFTGPTKLEQTLFYDKSAGSLDTTGFACAGLSSGSNGASATFVFECGGGAGNSYQRIVYSCWNVSGTWNTSKNIDEGGNKFDVTASANGSTITFTFKSRSGTQYYTPRVHVQAMGQSIVTTY